MTMYKKDVDSWPPPPSHSRTIPKDEAKEAILTMAKKASRPLLVGVAAIKLGYFWNIFRTEELFEELVDEGKLRMITQDEQKFFGLDCPDGYFSV